MEAGVDEQKNIGDVVSTQNVNKQFNSSVFIGHGSPMNIVADNIYTKNLKKIGEELQKPKVILCVSAHWVTGGTQVVSSENPKQIYDFYGFPDELYKFKYNPVGNSNLALQLERNSGGKIRTTKDWGLDHGSWAVLCRMYPKADVSSLQLSLNQNLTPLQHLELAQEIKQSLTDDVLLLASGNIVHNLRELNWQDDAPAHPWALEFESYVLDILINKNLDSEEKVKKIFTSELLTKAHPTIEHLLPLVYSLGMGNSENQTEVLIRGIQNASISMAEIKF